ncbi:MAG: bifunctional homocysteine S-methyltransferase/methylenetetrahydrofolate reductase [Anaerolineaceae bacterium]|nr:bifunctional homocysteine S-methyltransferase/methylenetetrahydrofolate reductase [Anaerolineaceae bacterium]
MKPGSFLKALEARGTLVADGAMGTMLNTRHVDFNHCFDELNISNPALVGSIHSEYIQAGAQLIKTNTFGANRFKLARHGLEDKLVTINHAGVNLAQKVVAGSFQDVFIAGDIGPLGVRLSPFGRILPEDARQAFAEQAATLHQAGVDLFLIETMTDLYEIREAIAAVKMEAPELAVIASMTFTRDDRTRLGDGPEKVVHSLLKDGADIVGINCSGGPAQLLRILKVMYQAIPTVRYSVMPNAGWPEQVGGRIMYPAAADYFGDYADAFRQNGAVILGGCCGTTPQHIAALRQTIDRAPDVTRIESAAMAAIEYEESRSTSDQTSQLECRLKEGRFVVAGEMDPPRGLATHKLIAGANLMKEAGADVIDVADSPMARMRMSPWAVCRLIEEQAKIETVLHFPTRGRNLLRIQGDLLAAYALGIRNVFVVMGDPTAIGDYPDAMDDYDLVPSGLIRLIKEDFNTGVDHSGAKLGQPTSFHVGAALNLDPPDAAREIRHLKGKLEAGADFLLTQPVFDTKGALEFINCLKNEVAGFHIPLLVGILPLVNARHAAFINNEVPGIQVPDIVLQRMEAAGEKGVAEGVRIASDLIDEIKGGVAGVYLMPQFSRYDAVAELIDKIRSA